MALFGRVAAPPAAVPADKAVPGVEVLSTFRKVNVIPQIENKVCAKDRH
jgi:hypothetical protein